MTRVRGGEHDLRQTASHPQAKGYSPIGAQELVDRRRVDLHPQELRIHDGQDKANHRVLHGASLRDHQAWGDLEDLENRVGE